MIVWIIMKNGVVDRVIDNELSAIHHYNSLVVKYPLVEIIKKEVKSF